MSASDASVPSSDWRKTACILCECNCGIEVQTGGAGGRHLVRIRGDRAHPASQGYTCNKALRIDHYQNGPDRLTSPLRRRADGSFEPIDWDTAIREVAAKLAAVRDAHGGSAILYYGGGGQGNHLGGGHASATLAALGARYRSNALAQEKTGDFFVHGRMLGAGVRSDVEHAEVVIFVGKNPWQSHGFPRARHVLREIAKDPARTLVVIDPRRSETAELADVHLRPRPGSDAWLLSALIAVLVQERLLARDWLAEHADGLDEIEGIFGAIDVAAHCRTAGVEEEAVRALARRVAAAKSVALVEDLGIQMSPHSTLVSWLDKLVWALVGQFARPGSQYAFSTLAPLFSVSPNDGSRRTPVTGSRIISGLVPCNVIPDEILGDDPKRFRALIVESGNPAHSLADSQRMREALSALEVLVVIDVAMTETARLADYVLPAPSQLEKAEATFFNFDFPHNVFHLRRPVLPPLAGTLPEPEIHARLVEALGALNEDDLAPLRAALAKGRAELARTLFASLGASPRIAAALPVVLYRVLGPTLPPGLASAAALWGLSHRLALTSPGSLARAGFTGEGFEPGEKLFDAILAGESGVVFSVDGWEDCWSRVTTPGRRLQLLIPELVDELTSLAGGPATRTSPDFPFVLSAGERRSYTANTIFRDPSWRKKDADGALRIHPDDAARIGLAEGDRARVTTKRGSAETAIEIHDGMLPGHVSLPNGLGLDHPAEGGRRDRAGVAPNELTASEDRDPIAGTPWHKHVPARIERAGA